MIHKLIAFFLATCFLYCQISIAQPIPENAFTFTHQLFGLLPTHTETELAPYDMQPSPFKQANSYQLMMPPIAIADFPMITVTLTDQKTLCQVSGSFAVAKESPRAVETLFRLVIHFSNIFGRPDFTDSGIILWRHIPENELNIKKVAILTDQLPEEITLVSVAYFLSDDSPCMKEIIPQLAGKTP